MTLETAYILQKASEGGSTQKRRNDALSLLYISQDTSIIHLRHQLTSHQRKLTLKAASSLTATASTNGLHYQLEVLHE